MEPPPPHSYQFITRPRFSTIKNTYFVLFQDLVRLVPFMSRAPWLGQARGRALRPHDELYPCVKYEMHVQNWWGGPKSFSRKLPWYQCHMFDLLTSMPHVCINLNAIFLNKSQCYMSELLSMLQVWFNLIAICLNWYLCYMSELISCYMSDLNSMLHVWIILNETCLNWS